MRDKTEVTVNFGPFKGCRGKILSPWSSKRIMVQIVLKNPSLPVKRERPLVIELDRDMVDRAK